MAPESLLLLLIVVLGALLLLLTLATQLQSSASYLNCLPVSRKRPRRDLATSRSKEKPTRGGGKTIVTQKRKREWRPTVEEIFFKDSDFQSRHLHTPCSK